MRFLKFWRRARVGVKNWLVFFGAAWLVVRYWLRNVIVVLCSLLTLMNLLLNVLGVIGLSNSKRVGSTPVKPTGGSQWSIWELVLAQDRRLWKCVWIFNDFHGAFFPARKYFTFHSSVAIVTTLDLFVGILLAGLTFGDLFRRSDISCWDTWE